MGVLDRDRLSDAECEAVFDSLLPLGFAGEDVVAEIAPEGWERSPLLAVFHPSVDQVHRESLRLHRNLESLRRNLESRRRTAPHRPPEPEPTLESVRETWRPTRVDQTREARELIAMCLWDVFSDNHEVLAPDGRVVDIGSFRGAAGFLADLLNRQSGGRDYDYMDFYMGSIWVSDRADLTPVYTVIFRRLQARGFDWEYVFPRLHALDMRPLRAELDDADRGAPERAAYDPSQAVLAEMEAQERDREVTELQESLEEAHREAIEDAKHRPPPATVRAYRAAYGQFPLGWPPWE